MLKIERCLGEVSLDHIEIVAVGYGSAPPTPGNHQRKIRSVSIWTILPGRSEVVGRQTTDRF